MSGDDGDFGISRPRERPAPGQPTRGAQIGQPPADPEEDERRLRQWIADTERRAAAEARLHVLRRQAAELASPGLAKLRADIWTAYRFALDKWDRPTVAQVAGEHPLDMSESALNVKRRAFGLTGEWPPEPPSEPRANP